MAKSSNSNYYRINVRVTQSEWIKFQKYKEEGLSARSVLEYSGCPCSHCKGVDVLAFKKSDGEAIKIQRGILNKRK